jgi:hypothetical protein
MLGQLIEELMFMANTEFAPGTGVIAWEIVK